MSTQDIPEAEPRNKSSWFNNHTHQFNEPKPIDVDGRLYMPGVFEPYMSIDEMELGGEG